jgi:hypothetical protein
MPGAVDWVKTVTGAILTGEAALVGTEYRAC